jgi:beta-lactam-binding protein with PASTA domain
MFNFFKTKALLKHFLYAVFFLFLLFLGVFKFLDYYTEHNRFLKVPNFKNLHINALDSIFKNYELRYEIIDSVFDKQRSKGIVVNQYPSFGTNVKRDRKVFLTINSVKNKIVKFPDVFDLTLRQAVNSLKKHGFEIGELHYKSDIAINKVLECKLNGIALQIEQELQHGSTIDLIVAKGLSRETVFLPNLVGLSKLEANIILKSNSLNLGLLYYDDEVKDSSSATVYSQYPKFSDKIEVNLGSSVDLFFRNKNID